MVKCSVAKELELSAKKMLRYKMVSKKMASYDKDQQKEVAKFVRRVEISGELPAVPKTALKKNESRKRKKSVSGSGSRDGASSPEVSRPRLYTA